MSAVDDAITEINTQLGILGPQYEGLRDFSRLNLKPETHQEIARVLLIYDRRVGILSSVRDLLVKLAADGHPTFATHQVTGMVLADLQDNAASIAAALGQFVSDPASTLGLTSGTPEVKS